MFFGYSSRFYKSFHEEVAASASVIVPIALELTRARRVVDVGCGDGTWLSVFERHGASELLGLDGEYVNRAAFRVDRSHFRPMDLSQARPDPALGHFDLAVSLEVAEHLAPERAPDFVRFLTSLAPVVMFSAAIPMQDGTGHRNERWPDYWATLFETCGYAVADAIRPRIWQSAPVAAWYRQNILIYVDRSRLPDYPALAADAAVTRREMLSVVHPAAYDRSNCRPMGPWPTLAAWLPRLLAIRLARRLARRAGRPA
jgi:SAM-dependent methyltransferase